MDDHQERELRAEFEAWFAAQPLPYVLARMDPQQAAFNAFAAGRRSSPSTQRQGEEARDAARDISIASDKNFMDALDAYMDAVTFDERNSDRRVEARKKIFAAVEAWRGSLNGKNYELDRDSRAS